jgi:signal transduction histidine kinase
MIAADLPQDEVRRLESLHRLQVLDSAPEAEFDALVRAASLVCGTPFSLISLVDAERQWFKANHGLDGATETPRQVAFCAHAILGEGLFEVPDALQDERFHDNPLVTQAPSLRFYAGVPLTMDDGSRVGTLCVASQQPQVLDDKQRAILRELSTAAARALETRRAALAEREALQTQSRANAVIAQILALSPDGFAALDSNEFVSFCSPRFEELAQTGLRSLVGLPLEAVLGHMQALAPGAQATTAIATDLRQAPMTLALPGPGNRMLELSWHEGHTAALPALLRLRDVSRQYELDRLKSEFLAVAAHELRTPMTSIYGFTELLLMRNYSPEQQKPILKKIHSQCQAMMEVTSELLDLSRLEARGAGDLDRRPLQLRDVVLSTAADFKPPEGRDPPVLDVPDGLDICVLGDRSKLRQVVSNLLSNAYKYSPGGGPVRVALSVMPDQHRVELTVADAGIGMSADELAHVTERFYRADRTGTIAGTGLGMSIVKEIVSLHSGQLALSSQPAKGTVVTVRLPSLVVC